MPWSVKEVDKHKKGLTPAQKKKWVRIANSTLKSCQAAGESDCEGRAVRVANSAFAFEDILDLECLTHINVLIEDYINDELSSETDAYFATKAEDRKKPGGSNVGKYKKGPFCGPSGGAPKGTYPVNTRKRAIAAIAYARHAPNPSGIKSCVCRHWPGLAACKSKKKTSQEVIQMGVKREKVPQSALHLMETDCFARAIGEDTKETKLEMTIYSGGVIKNHFWWGDLAIDLEGGKFPKGKFPILENHNTDRKIGFSNGKPIVDKSLRVDPEKVKFVDSEAAHEFVKLSRQGFPYESSMYARPTTIEKLEPGASAQVNGFNLKGPATIWRQWEFKEASVCVFGWDSNTKSQAFANTEVELDLDTSTVQLMEEETTEKEVIQTMTLEELKEQNPEAYDALMDEAKGAVTEGIKTDLEKKFADEKKQMETKFSQEKGELQDRVLELEKRDAIRTENEIRANADALWARKLSESEIPEHLFAKVSRMVSYNKFVSDGKFDQAEFVKAVDAEIKDWEDKGVTSTVLGMSFTSKSEDGSSEEDVKLQQKSVDDDVDKLASFLQAPQMKQ